MQSTTRRVRAAGAVLVTLIFLGAGTAALAQFLPKMPGMSGGKKPPKEKHGKTNYGDSEPHPPGVPIPMDHPVVASFQKLEQQSVYHYKMSFPDLDPQMAQMVAQFGITPAETTVAGDLRLVTMDYKMQAFDRPGQMDDWTILGLSKNGRTAHKFTSPAVPRILKYSDEQFAKQLAILNKQAAQSIAMSLAQGPTGWISAGMTAGMTATMDAAAPAMLKKSHEMFEWKCDGHHSESEQAVDKSGPLPFTDVKAAGHAKIDGVDATTYEFFVHEGEHFMGPMRMHIAKDTGLPLRIEMAGGGMPVTMRMDYFGYGQGGEIEVPACMSK